ncbi:lactoylglutathione lyase [Pandoraea sp. PE-S2R-1]|uniref:lactoylglutathione lyase n=1 Tax=Pandoraea sp. PE-S2R-1 TaxID=1986994 RepID=UPI000B3FBB68|nr:lactoylglutathione lyase [Pandoraea sp. PE-S2R-1]
MSLHMSRVILYVRNVSLLSAFYQKHFDLPVVEEIVGEWVVLRAGAVELALHLVGEPFRGQLPTGTPSNAKLVFTVPSGLPELRERLIHDGVRMRELKRYDGFPLFMCDGEDPEGNVFQLAQPD